MSRTLTVESQALMRIISSAAYTSWESRWISINNGMLLWYLNEIQPSPEGLAKIIGQVSTSDRKLENGATILAVPVETVHGLSTIEISLNDDEAKILQMSVNYNASKSRNLFSSFQALMDFHRRELVEYESSSVSSLKLQVKGEAFDVIVSPLDDVDALCESVVTEHSLKPEMRVKIESELLRTKIECHKLYENKLKSHISWLHRRLGNVVATEERAASAERHSTVLFNALYNLESMVPHLEKQLEDSLNSFKMVEATVEVLEMEIKAEKARGVSLHREADVARENVARMEQTAYDVSSQLVDAQSKIEALRIERNALKAKNIDGGSVAGAAPDDIQSLRHQRATLTKQLELSQENLKRITGQLVALQGKKASQRRGGDFSDTLTDEDILLLNDRILGLEETGKTLRQRLSAADEANKTLQLQCDNFYDNLKSAQSALARCEENLAKAKVELRDCRMLSSTKYSQELVADNSRLREQSLCMRGEVLRLQNQIEEVKSSAMQAMQALQVLGPGASLGELMGGLDISALAGGLGLDEEQKQRDHDRYHERDQERDRDRGYYDYSAGDGGGGADADSLAGASSVDVDLRPGAVGSSRRGGPSAALGAMFPPPPSTATVSSTAPLGALNTAASGGISGMAAHQMQFASRASLAQSDGGNSDAAGAAAGVGGAVVEPPMDGLFTKISPAVEERLLRVVFAKYDPDKQGRMNLTRFGRFAKEFNIASSGPGQANDPPYIVSGEVDIVFRNASKVTMDGDDVQITKKDTSAFVVGRPRVATSHQTPTLDIKQFTLAVEMLARRVYAGLIEQQTGTTLECLPPKQREVASKAALEVLIKKKLFPAAEKLDIIPWSFIFLEQAVATLTQYSAAHQSLTDNATLLTLWFTHYATPKHTAVQAAMNGEAADSLAPGAKVSYKTLSQFAHDFGIVPYILKEPDFYSMFKEIREYCEENAAVLLAALPDAIARLPLVLEDLGGDGGGGAAVVAAATAAAGGIVGAVGVTSGGGTPAAIAGKANKARGVQLQSDGLGLGGFVYMVSTTAIKAFSDISPDSRISRLFEWLSQSGGSYLLIARENRE